jgi:major protein 2|nr:MAG TPA: Putative tail protein [Caudoviricetes sp.]
MARFCQCPGLAALKSIPNATCSEGFGQIQKVIFQRLRQDNGKPNAFTTEKPITKLANLTPLLAANDSTKIVVSPYLQAPSAEPGAARKFGGGNDTLGGIEITIGREPTAFTCVIRNAPQSQIKAMKYLSCETDVQNLGVFLVNEDGAIGAIKDAKGAVTPIPIFNLFISDKGFGGFENPDSNNVSWSFLPNWSDDFAIITPDDYNPLTDLKNA